MINQDANSVKELQNKDKDVKIKATNLLMAFVTYTKIQIYNNEEI